MARCVNHVGRPQRRYNSVHCKTRVKMEEMFGIWKSRFRCLHKSWDSMLFRQSLTTVDPLYCGGGSNYYVAQHYVWSIGRITAMAALSQDMT